MADWREPIKLKDVTEKGGLYGIHTEHNEVLMEIDSSKETGDDGRAMHLMQNGLACANCTSTFPARPSIATEKEFRAMYNLWPIDDGIMRDRVVLGACPVCGFRVDQREKLIEG